MKSITDYILTHFFMWQDFDANKRLKIEKEITNKKKNKKAIFFYPYWTGKSTIYKGLAKKFPDYTLIFYDYPNEVMSEDVDVSRAYLKEILDDSLMKIKQLKKEGYEEITLVGSSLGADIALSLATITEVDKLVLNMLDVNMAQDIFDSSAMIILKTKLKKHGFTREKIRKIYDFISPEFLIEKIKNKKKIKILIFESKTDIFCTVEQLKPILSKLKRNNIHYRLKSNFIFGHILSIYKNLFFSKTIVKFIKE